MRETECRSADGRMARILFIDDDEQTVDLFGQILEGADHEVIIARDGVTGIAHYRKNPTDLIITDIMMPVKDGMEVINELKRDFPQAKIIAISGSDREARRERSEEHTSELQSPCNLVCRLLLEK